jgi:hypothetical protein
LDHQLLAILAKAAGLEKALADFPDDVEAAAEQAMKNTAAVLLRPRLGWRDDWG